MDDDLDIDIVFSGGNKMMEKGKMIVEGTFEK